MNSLSLDAGQLRRFSFGRRMHPGKWDVRRPVFSQASFFWERGPTFVDDKRHKKEKTEPAKTAVFPRFSVTGITKPLPIMNKKRRNRDSFVIKL